MLNIEHTIDSIFTKVVYGHQPYLWQRKLGQRKLGQIKLGQIELGQTEFDQTGSVPPASLDNRLIRIPTGMGKTLGVLSTWLLHRVLNNQQNWPTRLVWCLPMRVLVEQTAAAATMLVEQMGVADDVGVHLLMGGVEESHWYDSPHSPAILIGTQDMLLSRALNRGYAMYRAAWPRAFGLLNTDALWVMDEVQLMGAGFTTSAQLQVFAQMQTQQKNGIRKPRATWWLSATLQPDCLQTPETEPFMSDLRDSLLTVDAKDRKGPLWQTNRPVELIRAGPDVWADLVVERHQTHIANPDTGRQTLVVVNTVRQAVELYKKIHNKLKSAGDQPETILIHSQFRAAEREAWLDSFLSRDKHTAKTNRILIATQVVEAGVDISASCLFTLLAPWSNLVQRFGRAARHGGMAEVVVLDQQHTDAKHALPYTLTQLNASRDAISQLDDVSTGRLEEYEAGLTRTELARLYPHQPLHVLLLHELEELFDTSPDLAGADMDISRFICDGDEMRDIQVFWRSWEGKYPPAATQPARRELCAVPVTDACRWIKSAAKNKLYTWSYLVGEWVAADAKSLRPGMVIVAATAAGGYCEKLGFTGEKPKRNETVSDVSVSDVSVGADQSVRSDAEDTSEALSDVRVWKTIATHGRDAMLVGNEVADAVKLDDELTKVVALALRLHDWGKAHPAFAAGTYTAWPERGDLAMAPHWRPKEKLYCTGTHGPRHGFRHELASCLAVLELLRGFNPWHNAILGGQKAMLVACGLDAVQQNGNWPDNRIAHELNELSASQFNLLLFLIASHHGKMRVSMQASPKDQEFPIEDNFVGRGYPVCGVREADELLPVALPLPVGEEQMPVIQLSLAPASMGLSARYGHSWTERIGSLLQYYGLFTLAYLEAIVRAADGLASIDSRPPCCVEDPLLAGVRLSGSKIAEVITADINYSATWPAIQATVQTTPETTPETTTQTTAEQTTEPTIQSSTRPVNRTENV